MKKHLLGLSVLMLALLVAGCNDSSSGGDSAETGGDSAEKSDVNVAAAANGATVTTTYLPDTAGHLIDGDATTTHFSEAGTPIIVEFARVENITSFTLTRLAASAPQGTSPAILIELSSDGVTYEKSNVSIIFGGVSCTTIQASSTSQKCEMSAGRNVSHIRITTTQPYQFTQLEAIANK